MRSVRVCSQAHRYVVIILSFTFYLKELPKTDAFDHRKKENTGKNLKANSEQHLQLSTIQVMVTSKYLQFSYLIKVFWDELQVHLNLIIDKHVWRLNKLRTNFSS